MTKQQFARAMRGHDNAPARCAGVFVCDWNWRACMSGHVYVLCGRITRDLQFAFSLRKFCICYCGYKRKAVLLHRQSKNSKIMWRDPTCYVSDIEAMTGKSYRTAQRIMAKIRNHFQLKRFERPTIDQVEIYLKKDQFSSQ